VRRRENKTDGGDIPMKRRFLRVLLACAIALCLAAPAILPARAAAAAYTVVASGLEYDYFSSFSEGLSVVSKNE
jgi:hypothetical protein